MPSRQLLFCYQTSSRKFLLDVQYKIPYQTSSRSKDLGHYYCDFLRRVVILGKLYLIFILRFFKKPLFSDFYHNMVLIQPKLNNKKYTENLNWPILFPSGHSVQLLYSKCSQDGKQCHKELLDNDKLYRSNDSIIKQ